VLHLVANPEAQRAQLLAQQVAQANSMVGSPNEALEALRGENERLKAELADKMRTGAAALPLITHEVLLITHAVLLITHEVLLITHAVLLITHEVLLITHAVLLITHAVLLIICEVPLVSRMYDVWASQEGAQDCTRAGHTAARCV
jgi:uncharacterized small protein (DUF1192 family)